MATTEYEVGVYITLLTSTYVLNYWEESILKAKVFMRGKKMGWVRQPRSLHLQMLIPTTEVLCESATASLPTSLLSAQCPFLVEGLWGRRQHVSSYMRSITHVVHVFFVAGNHSNPSKTAERGLLTGSGSV